MPDVVARLRFGFAGSAMTAAMGSGGLMSSVPMATLVSAGASRVAGDSGSQVATVASVVDAGAEWLVAGHAIFGDRNAEKAAAAIKEKAIAAVRGK